MISQRHSDFRSRYTNQKITIGGKLRTAADVWLQHPQRRSYNGIIFSPAQETEQFNLFQGFRRAKSRGLQPISGAYP